MISRDDGHFGDAGTWTNKRKIIPQRRRRSGTQEIELQNKKDLPSEADALPDRPVVNVEQNRATPGGGASEADAKPDAVETAENDEAERPADHDRKPDEPRDAFSGRSDD